ncbi:MAG: hypothetical protein QM726_14790 [Chitinophagaceae bacterium]
MATSIETYLTVIKRRLLLLMVGLLCIVALPFFTTNANSYQAKAQTELVCLFSRKPVASNTFYKSYNAQAVQQPTVHASWYYKATLSYHNALTISRINCLRKKFLPKTNAFLQTPLKLPAANAEEAIS